VMIQSNWDTMSIRCSASNDIVWENIFVSDKDVIDRPAHVVDTFIKLLCSWGIPPLDACYLGMAHASRDYAIGWTSARTQVPFLIVR
jgi:alkylation response protein AidB-like acyl-CoA dehydrogenase